MPLAFEINVGQYGPDVQFVARSTSATISLNKGRATLYVHNAKCDRPGVTIVPLGMNPSVTVEGLDATKGRSNYFWGNDPSKWVTNVARYSRVRYRGVYPGIDLIFHGNQRNIEYDFVVAPGADPNRIELKFTGADSLKLERSGDLTVAIGGGLSLTQRLPILYQEEKGIRRKVPGSYVIRGKNRIGFRVGDYVRSRALVIDPVVGYSARFTGITGSSSNAIAVDASGNAYVTGSTETPDLPILPGSFEVGNTTQNILFVYKLNSTGTDFVYTTLIGGSGGQYGTGIAVDGQGNAYVTGITPSTDFPVTQGAYQTTLPTSTDHGFVLKLNAAGNALVYSTFVAGNYPDTPNAIAIDASGNAYITGSTESSTFPVTPGAFQSSLAPGAGSIPATNAFVTKLNSTGTALVYSTYLGGAFVDSGNGIAVDSDGNAYVAGSTSSYNFPVTDGAFQTVSGGDNGFVTKLNPTGTSLVYSTYINAANGSFASGVAVDSTGSAYVAGTGSAAVLGTPVLYGRGGIFVAKLNSAGSALSYLTSVGGSDTQQSTGMALDSSGNVYVSGWGNSTDFPLLSPVQTAGPSATDGFPVGVVFKLNPTGSLAYSTYFGSDYDKPNAIAVDPNSNAYITGTATSVVFPVTPGAVNVDTAPSGPSDGIFVAQLSSTEVCNFTFAPTSPQEPASGATDSISVTAPTGCNWIALAGQNWALAPLPGIHPLAMPGITVTSPSAGSGSGVVTFSVPPNTNPARTEILSIAGTSIPISQADGCTYQLSRSSISVSALGGLITNAIAINTATYCPFTLSNPPAWVSLGTFTGGTVVGPGDFDLQISANNTGAPRSVILTVAGLPFVINQAGGLTSCVYSVSPTTSTINYVGLSGTFSVSTGAGCSWTLATDSAWLQITSVSSSYSANSTVGTGNGTVHYTVVENTSSSKRSGVITIEGKTFTVTQGGLGVISAGPVTPNLGSGATQTFALQYSDTAGAANLQQVWVYFNATLANPASNSCLLYYNATTNQINLLGDNGTAWQSATLGSAPTLQNSQCSLKAAATVAISGNTLTLTLPMSFQPAFDGAKNIYLRAIDASGPTSGWQQLGVWNVGASMGTPAAISVTPASGSGPNQTFALQYSDTAGAANFRQVWAYFNSTLANPASNACLLYYDSATSQINLLGDSGTTWQAAILGTAVTLQNSQCSVNAATATVAQNANTLTLNLPMTFKPTYAGAKNVYLRATDASGTSSAWQPLGAWTVTITVGTPAAVSVTPNSGPAANQTFALEYSDTSGAADLEQVWVYFNATLANPATGACLLYYNPATSQINLLGDNGMAWQVATLGTGNTLQNSQCSVSAAATTAAQSGNTLTLNLAMMFQPAYDGTKNIYLRAIDISGTNSGWQQLGTVSVTTTANRPATVSVTPSSGSGTSQIFTLQYYDSSGAASLEQVWVYFNATLANPASNACLLYYNPATRQINLLGDNGTAWQSATLGTLQTLQNSQCSVSVATATLGLNGSILTWNLPMTFTPAYAGSKNVYLRAVDEAGLTTIWQQYGTWTVP